MANHFIKEPKEFTQEVRKFETIDRGHADVFNAVINPLINNDSYLKEKLEAVSSINDTHIKNTAIHVTEEDKSKWDNKAEKTVASTSSDGLMPKADKSKIDGIAPRAEVNQNAISNVKVGSTVVQANGKVAQVEFVSGANISIAADNASKKVTIAVNTADLDADTLDGKHAKVTLATTEKIDLAAAINEVVSTKVDKISGKQLSTNDYTNADKTKLSGIAANSNNYTHPSTHSASIITQDANNRFVTDADKTKLSGIAANANNYTHPSVHPASMITQDANNRFVSDTEKNTWNGKANTAVATTSANGLMAAADKVKLNGISNYTHPANHPASMISQDANNRFTSDVEKLTWNNHVNSRSNPHGITSAQIGAAPTEHTHYYASSYNTEISGTFSHNRKSDSIKGSYSFATGKGSIASGEASFVEGLNTNASGKYSHAAGEGTNAMGGRSFAMGCFTRASYAQLAIGVFNKKRTGEYDETYTSGSSFFTVGNGNSTTNPSNAFVVDFSGRVYTGAGGSYNSSGADYGEFFEWLDGNPDEEDRVGYFVTSEGEQIKIANKDDYIVGVISGISSVIGNSDEDYHYRYKTDNFGRLIYERVQTELGAREAPIVSESYDYTKKYISRSERKEWDVVGMLGQLIVRDNGQCKVNGYCTCGDNGMAVPSDIGYRVITRVTDNVIKVIFR